LYQNYPNPFNPSTEIKFGIKKNGHVKLYIYNSLGQIVTRLIDKYMNAGTYTAKWDGLDNNGKKGSSGTYYYNIQVDGRTQTKKMLLLK
jgi:flagellar hook assembly protein FlgD